MPDPDGWLTTGPTVRRAGLVATGTAGAGWVTGAECTTAGAEAAAATCRGAAWRRIACRGRARGRGWGLRAAWCLAAGLGRPPPTCTPTARCEISTGGVSSAAAIGAEVGPGWGVDPDPNANTAATAAAANASAAATAFWRFVSSRWPRRERAGGGRAQGLEVKRGIGVTAPTGALEGRPGSGRVAALCQQRPEARCGGGVAVAVGVLVCPLGAAQIAVFLEHDPEVERTVGVAAALGPAIGPLGVGDVAALLEQYAEVHGGGGVTARVGLAIRTLGRGQLSPGPRTGPRG